MSVAERKLLFRLASGLGPRPVVVEVGSYLGASASFLGLGVRDLGGTVYAVDTWRNEGMTEGPRDTYREFLANTAPVRDLVTPLRGPSPEVAAAFDQPIDLLFIDGDHSYDAARDDISAWLPKLRDGGLVVVHDYSWADGVRKAVRELVVPLQTEGGRKLDTIYWTRVGKPRNRTSLEASIVVPTRGRGSYLGETLAALLEQSGGTSYEVLVVDNAPRPEVRQTVIELGVGHPDKKLRYLHEPRPGLLHARHKGARDALSEILVYVDDDVIVRPDWLEALLAPMSDPEVGVAGGKIVARWEADPPPWLDQFPGGYLSLLDLGPARGELAWPATVYGCNMAVRRTALFECGGFNPDALGSPGFPWKRGDGETGLQRKVLDSGYRIIYTPEAVVEHRIPRERLTRSAFYRRGLMTGLSLSYAALRSSGTGPRFFVKAVLRTGVAVLRSFRWALRGALERRRRVRWVAESRMGLGYAAQHSRAIVDPSLRRHLLRPTYLD